MKQALAIPSNVFCRGDSISEICPMTGFWTCLFSQPVSNKIEKNEILSIIHRIQGTAVRSDNGRWCGRRNDPTPENPT